MSKMGGAIIRVLCFISFLSSIIPKGVSEPCTPDRIQIVQRQTGRIINSRTEWEADVIINCTCNIGKLQLLCPNFESVSTDLSIISEIGNTGVCNFYNGRDLNKSDTYIFFYIGDLVNFAPYSYNIGRCY